MSGWGERMLFGRTLDTELQTCNKLICSQLLYYDDTMCSAIGMMVMRVNMCDYQ